MSLHSCPENHALKYSLDEKWQLLLQVSTPWFLFLLVMIILVPLSMPEDPFISLISIHFHRHSQWLKLLFKLKLPWIIIFMITCLYTPFDPKSDEKLISPYNITPEAHMRVKRVKEMIKKWWSSWLFCKFSLSAPWEMYRKQYGEYAYWC